MKKYACRARGSILVSESNAARREFRRFYDAEAGSHGRSREGMTADICEALLEHKTLTGDEITGHVPWDVEQSVIDDLLKYAVDNQYITCDENKS